MRHTILWCLLAMAMVTLLTLGLVQGLYGFEQLRRPADATAERQPVEDGGFLLGIYQQRLAVYLPGRSEPEMLFDVYVQQLPPYDQEQLKTGIVIRDYQTLVEKIEDYIS